MTRDDLRELLVEVVDALSTLVVVFHEPLNLRGDAIPKMHSAAIAAGC